MEQSPGSSRFVRQFALTRGRTRSTGADLPLDTLVRRTDLGQASISSQTSQQAAIMRLTASPIAIAEISAHLHLHLGIARVLVSDLAALGHVVVSEPDISDDGPDLPILERLLDDLQSL